MPYTPLSSTGRVPMAGRLRIALRSLCCVMLMAVGATQALAQHAALVPAEDPVYDVIDRMQRRGYFRELNPSVRPYTVEEIRSALSKVDPTTLQGPAADWYAQLDARFGTPTDEDAVLGRYSVQGRLFQSSSRRQDALRPLDPTPFVDPGVDFRAALGWQQWVASAGVTFDLYYDRDPDGLDVVNRFFMRGEDSYLGFSSRFFTAHLGRFGTHWARVGQEAVLIGNDARQYDRLQLRIGTDRISLRSVYGELDNLDERGRFSGRGFREGSTRRYVFAHRLDWRPHDRWTFTLTEGDLVSGQNAGLSLKYLQPFHLPIFESDNTPKNYENNLMVGGGLQYHGNRFMFTVQGIIDDIVVFDRKELKEEGKLEPATGQLTAMATVSEVLRNIDFGWQGALVSSLSYRTDQKEGQWTYAQRGLASLFADYVHTRVFADWYADDVLPGLTLSPGLDLLFQGRGDYRDDFIEKYEDGRTLPNVLSGLESTTLRPSVRVDYRAHRFRMRQDGGVSSVEFGVKADLGVNATWNERHVAGERSLLWQNTAAVRLKMGF